MDRNREPFDLYYYALLLRLGRWQIFIDGILLVCFQDIEAYLLSKAKAGAALRIDQEVKRAPKSLHWYSARNGAALQA
jgi:hypothetical protein